MNVFFFGRGERMVHRDVALSCGVVIQERELLDPEEVELPVVDETQLLSELEPYVREHHVDYVRGVGGEEYDVAVAQLKRVFKVFFFFIAKEFDNWGLPFFAGDADPREALGPEGLCCFAEVVDFLSRKVP